MTFLLGEKKKNADNIGGLKLFLSWGTEAVIAT